MTEPTAFAFDPNLRDMDRQPYDEQERRVAAYIVKSTGIGGGNDPIGFLIASHAQLGKTNEVIKENVVRILASCGEETHGKMTFEQFDAAGGLKCPLCLAKQAEALRARAEAAEATISRLHAKINSIQISLIKEKR